MTCTMTIYFKLFVFYAILIKTEAQSKTQGQNSSDDLNYNTLKKRNLKGARWNLNNQDILPVHVYFSLEILELSKISPKNGEFRLDFNLRQRWVAPESPMPKDFFWKNETSNTSVTIDGDAVKDMWTPDAYIPNSRDAEIEILTFPQTTITIFKNNTIIYSSNMFTINGCSMEFQWYPMETQRCIFPLESYSYTDTSVVFHWENTTEKGAVTLPANFNIRQYVLLLPFKFGNDSVNRFGRGESYSRIYVEFFLQRRLGHFILQTFMPTCFIVSLSWFSFWLGMDAIPGRVSLLVTCMLTLVTLYSGQKVDLPPISYVKMMDVWMTSCLAFIFAAMFEFIIVRYLAKKELDTNGKKGKAKQGSGFLPMYWQDFYRQKKPKSMVNDELRMFEAHLGHGPVTAWSPAGYDESLDFQTPNQNGGRLNDKSILRRAANNSNANSERSNVNGQGHATGVEESTNQNTRRWKRIDKVARVAFPLLFLCFCLIFWPVLMFGDPNEAAAMTK